MFGVGHNGHNGQVEKGAQNAAQGVDLYPTMLGSPSPSATLIFCAVVFVQPAQLSRNRNVFNACTFLAIVFLQLPDKIRRPDQSLRLRFPRV